MPVKVRIYGQEATFSQGCWACEDDSLLALLQALADPRACAPEQERAHALYAAGRYGGMIASADGWEEAPHPAPELRLADFVPPTAPQQAGWLGFLRRRR